MRRPWLVLALAAGCSDGTRLEVVLVLPDEPSPAGAVAKLQLQAAWNGGASTEIVPFADAGSLSLALPAGPVDVTVTGLAADGGRVWRGIARGVDVPAPGAGPAQATLFFAPLGQVALYGSTGTMPALAGSAAVAWGSRGALVSGGAWSDGGISAQLWAVEAGRIEELPFTSRAPRAHHLAAVALDGLGDPLLVLAGGDLSGGGTSAAVEAIADGGGADLAPLGAPQRYPAAALSPDGLELVVGCGQGGPAAVDVYLPAAALAGLPGAGREGALPLPGPCEQGQITWLPALGGAVAGFADGGLVLLDSAGVRPWGTPLPVRQAFGAVAVADGGALLQFGGAVGGVPAATLAEQPAAYAGGGLAVPRADFGWTVTSGGLVLVVGGRGPDGGALASAEIIDLGGHPAARSQPIQLARPRIRPAVVDISDLGLALIVSGEDADGKPVGGLEIYTYP